MESNIVILNLDKNPDTLVEIDGRRYTRKQLKHSLLEAEKWESSLDCDSSIDDMDDNYMQIDFNI